MRIEDFKPSIASMSLPSKRGALLPLSLFVLNAFVFSAWPLLSQLRSSPWLLLAWLYGLVTLAPLVWRDKAPIIVFIIESVLTVVAWPFMHLYIPVVGIPVALYAVTLNRSLKPSLCMLLLSLGPLTLAAASTLHTDLGGFGRVQVFVSTLVFLVMAAVGAVVLGHVNAGVFRHVKQLQLEHEATREMGVLSGERRRVAGVLVDVHQVLTVIVVQATRAARVADTDASQVTTALEQMGETAQQTLSELRRLFEALEVSRPTREVVGSGNPAGTPDRRT
jgi:signal transduction histidine kinase